MRYYIYGYTDKGSVKGKNEDAVLVNKEVVKEGFREAVLDAPFITAVCDGVGGENAGDVASELCLQQLSEVVYTSNTDLKQVLMAIHGKIKKRSTLDKASANMQTTLCALAVDEEGKGLCVNVGDSRLYRYVNGTIRQLTTDQSYVQYMYNKGEIDYVDEIEPEYRSAIISAMGSPQSDPQIEQTPLANEFGAEPDDMIIITSDGLSDHVSENEFEVGLSMDLPISEKLVALAKLAILNGSTDNVSIIGIKPFFDFEELAALTRHDAVGKTVNVMEMLEDHNETEEKDELSDILTIDLEAIIGKGKTQRESEKSYEIASAKVPEPDEPDETSIIEAPEPEESDETPIDEAPEPEETEETPIDEAPEAEETEETPIVEAPEPEESEETPIVEAPEAEESDETPIVEAPEPEGSEETPIVEASEPEEPDETSIVEVPETEEPDETPIVEAPEVEEPEETPIVEAPEPEEPDEIHNIEESEPEEHHDMVSREDIELEAHDLFMQAQASLSRLSGLIPKDNKSE